MSDAIESFNVEGLEKLLKALKRPPPVCRVGILGDKPRERKEGEKSPPTNAEIGAVWEFSETHPRSFLRIPISTNLQKQMEKGGLFEPARLKEVIRTGSVLPWMEEVAGCALACVSDAFETGGDGKWAPWTTPGYTNNTGQILIDTQQLRNSVSYEVREA